MSGLGGTTADPDRMRMAELEPTRGLRCAFWSTARLGRPENRDVYLLIDVLTKYLTQAWRDEVDADDPSYWIAIMPDEESYDFLRRMEEAEPLGIGFDQSLPMFALILDARGGTTSVEARRTGASDELRGVTGRASMHTQAGSAAFGPFSGQSDVLNYANSFRQTFQGVATVAYDITAANLLDALGSLFVETERLINYLESVLGERDDALRRLAQLELEHKLLLETTGERSRPLKKRVLFGIGSGVAVLASFGVPSAVAQWHSADVTAAGSVQAAQLSANATRDAARVAAEASRKTAETQERATVEAAMIGRLPTDRNDPGAQLAEVHRLAEELAARCAGP